MVEQTTISHGGHNPHPPPPPPQFSPPPSADPSAPISPPQPQSQQPPPPPPLQSNGAPNGQCVDGSPAIGYPYNPHQQYQTAEQQSLSTVTANVYMNSATAIPMSTVGVIHQGPPDLPCCGIGLGWFLFILGFFFGLPWYIGAGALLCCKYDRREKPGYIACAVLAVIFTILIIISSVRSGGSSSY